MKRHLLKGQRGLTLIEVTVALSLLSLVLLCLTYVLGTSSRANLLSKQRLRATSLASSLLEYLGSTAAEELAKFSGVDTRKESSFPVDPEGKGICRRWRDEIKDELNIEEAFGSIQVEANTPNPGRTRITVMVLWPKAKELYRVSLVEVR